MGEHNINVIHAAESDEIFFENLGRETGAAHREAKRLTHKIEGLSVCLGEADRQRIEAQMPSKNGALRDAFRQLADKIDMISKEPDTYGIIQGNLPWDCFNLEPHGLSTEGLIECRQSWFVEEIATLLYLTVYAYGDDAFQEREEVAKRFMNHFMKGYLMETVMGLDTLKQISHFLKLVEIKVHLSVCGKWDFEDLTQWQCDFYEQSKARILHRIPIVAFRKEWYSETKLKEMDLPTVTVQMQPNFTLLFVS